MHAAIHWLMKCSDGGVLKPSNSTTIGGTSMTVLEALGPKHSDPCAPPDWILPAMEICHSLRILKLLDPIFYQLHISYKEVLILVSVILHIGEIFC